MRRHLREHEAGVPDLLALCYHLVDPHCRDEMAVSPERLRGQVAGLLARGYRPRTWSDALAGSGGGDQRLLAVTFDDAFAGTYDAAFGVLAELGVVATVFAPTALVTRGLPLMWPGLERHALSEAQRRPASWAQLRDLAAHGWEVGSHTRTHPRLDRCTDGELVAELRGSREECEDAVQQSCPALAYPFGEAGPRVQRAALAAGYRTAAVLGCSPGGALPALTLPRTGVYRGDGTARFRLKVSRTARTRGFCTALGAMRAVSRIRAPAVRS